MLGPVASGEGRVDVAVELAGRVGGDVEQFDGRPGGAAPPETGLESEQPVHASTRTVTASPALASSRWGFWPGCARCPSIGENSVSGGAVVRKSELMRFNVKLITMIVTLLLILARKTKNLPGNPWSPDRLSVRRAFPVTGMATDGMEVSVAGSAAGAAADRHAAEAHRAGAAGLAAGRQALAAALRQLAAVLVAGPAGDAHPLGGRFAGAAAEAEVALGHADAVLGAGAAAHSLGEAAAEVLEGAAGGLIGAFAVDLEAVGTLLESQRAAWHRAPLGRLVCGSMGGGGSGGPVGEAVAQGQSGCHR